MFKKNVMLVCTLGLTLLCSCASSGNRQVSLGDKQITNELDNAPAHVAIKSVLMQIKLDTPVKDGTDSNCAIGSGLTGSNFSLCGEDLSSFLKAWDSDGKLEVLARPQILLRDNTEGEISIGQRVPITDSSKVSQNIGDTTSSVGYENVDVTLTVTPHTNADGFMILDVKLAYVSNDDLNATAFNKNSFARTVMVKDGETVVIGGLITTSKDDRKNKVPSTQEERRELLVVLTPSIVSKATTDKTCEILCDERD
jgi:type II secretory pathway component GspD/PulD (secretin)